MEKPLQIIIEIRCFNCRKYSDHLYDPTKMAMSQGFPCPCGTNRPDYHSLRRKVEDEEKADVKK